MKNQAIPLFHDSPGRGSSSWRTDHNPGQRLAWLFGLMLIPVCVILWRLYYLQVELATDFVVIEDRTSISYETIPASDGRILGADGRVLAQDVVQYDLLAHYRWIESPAHRGWLTRQAYSRLSPSQRRNRKRVETERNAVLKLRKEMWTRLARLTKTDPQTITQSRARVRKRIERMVASVKRRRHRDANHAEDRSNKPTSSSKNSRLESAWQAVVDAVTVPPRRFQKEPLILPEQAQYHEMMTGISREMAAEIEANPELYPSLRIRISTRRTYPQQSLAAHLIGNRLAIDAKELKARQEKFGGNDPLGYSIGDRIGKTGLERSYDNSLRGRPGLRKIVRNESGEVIRSELVREPRSGRDVILTLELELQQQMERLLDDVVGPANENLNVPTYGRGINGGCIVAIDVRTGEVLAAASAPRFDLNIVVDHRDEDWQRLLKDTRRPFFPRTTRMALPPGSVFKTLSAVALLESGKIDPDARMHCQGFLDHPNKHRCYIFRHFGTGHGDTNLNDAISRSCNVYFFSAARKLGPRPFIDWARRFGFGKSTGIDLPGETAGNLPSPLQYTQASNQGTRKRQRWYPGDTLGLAIGQSRLTVTPMQIARMMAAVANDGQLVTPHVVRKVGSASTVSRIDSDFPETPTFNRTHRILGLTEGTLERVREGLKRVVQHPRGTGYKKVRIPGITIAGKTGTAEVGGGKNDHAWFAGYVPADKPRIAFAVVLENAGSGGANAGPVAKKLVQALMNLGIVRTTNVARLTN